MRVLAVDDDPMTLMIVRGVVEAAGHECLTASDGNEGWDLVRSGAVEVVISDWRMPGMDGLELCRRIRAGGGRYTYIVLATSRTDGAQVLEGMLAGADDYLTKPLDLADLRVRLIAAERVSALHAKLADQQAELERLNVELAATARIDPLTGLRNRRALAEDLPRLLARCERHGHELSAVMLDVDHFKAYNDHFGHPAGDETLRRVAGVVLSAGRQADLFYRYGGEEFLCLFPQGTPAAVAAAERLRREVHALGLGHPGSSHGVVTLSAGVSTWSRGGAVTQEALLAGADAALYEAKADGRNAVRATEAGTPAPA
jgi:two-component system cell cycle response regulator